MISAKMTNFDQTFKYYKNNVKNMTIISTTKVSSSRVYLPIEIREKYNIKDGDTIIWHIENNRIILDTQENKRKNTERFKVEFNEITDK